MAHVSLYRKYRSQTFEDLIGQDHVVRTLQNAIATGRIAHAYLFTGPRGTGKTSTARLLAKCLCVEGGPSPTPDPTSEICQLIATGSCVDVIELDAASESGVDDIRQTIVEAVEYSPMMCPYKVFIIDEVHDLSPKAFDALLKTIEEPPAHVVFILATTEYNKVPTTIRSRCQKYEFHRASLANLVGRLHFVAEQEGVTVEPAALGAIARMADGAYRDALTLLEQVMLTTDGPVTLAHVSDQLGLVSEESIDTLLTSIHAADVPGIMNVLTEVARTGRDPRAVLESMMYRLADLTRAAYSIEIGSSLDASREAALHETASRIGREKLLQLRAGTAEAFRAIRDISLPRLWLESQLIGMASAARPIVKPAATEPTARPASKPAVTAVPQRNAEPAQSEAKPALGDVASTVALPVEDNTDEEEDVAAELLVARKIWKRMLASLVPQAHQVRLQGSRVVEVKNRDMNVELKREMDVDWLNDKPQRIGYISGLIKEAGDGEWNLKFKVNSKRGAPSQAAQAVELPAEGQALHDRATAVFKS